LNNHSPALATEQQVRDLLANTTFPFMVYGLAYWPVPCEPCNGWHIIVLPVRAEDVRRATR
jgi:hypothetical protein